MSDWSTLYPFLTLATGLAIVVVGIVVLRVNAFVSLLTAAMAVSFMAPGDWASKSARVAAAFGETCGNVGIVIALAAIIGKAMLDSGAADRVVRFFLDLLGERRAAAALSAGSCTLAIPVFFDTVFYLMVPLVRSMHRQTGKHYLLYLAAVATGAVTHALVPPTPGPLVAAANLHIDLGMMILMGIAVAVPAALVGVRFAHWIDGRLDIPMRPLVGEEESCADPGRQLPSLTLSLTPIILPTVLIAMSTFAGALAAEAPEGWLTNVASFVALVGNANFALLMSAFIAVYTYIKHCRPSRAHLESSIEQALMSAGVIILITAGGGAFGAMLKQAELAPAIEALFGASATGGFALLVLAFLMSALLKLAQGSTTAAIIVTSSMFAAMIEGAPLPYHPVYLALAICSGGLVGSWMNDSGFWIFTRMGGLTEVESLRVWTPMLAILGCTAMVATLVLASIFPMPLN